MIKCPSCGKRHAENTLFCDDCGAYLLTEGRKRTDPLAVEDVDWMETEFGTTGALDSRTGVEIMAIFQDLNAAGITIVIVTHEPDIARYAQRIITFRDGVVMQDEAVQSRTSARDILATWDNPAEAAQ